MATMAEALAAMLETDEYKQARERLQARLSLTNGRTGGNRKTEPDSPEPAPWTCPACQREYRWFWVGRDGIGWRNLGHHGNMEADSRCERCVKLSQLTEWLAKQEQDERERTADKYAEAAGINVGQLAGMRLKKFETEGRSESVIAAYNDALKYAAILRRGKLPPAFLLWGDNGCGKTHLSVALLAEALEAGQRIAILDEARLIEAKFNAMRNGNNGDGGELARSEEAVANQMIARARKADLLLWDDAGRAPIKQGWEWYRDGVLFPWLDARWRQDKPVIVTTNLSLDEFKEKIGPANWSRLSALCPVILEVRGPDYRLERRKSLKVKK